MTLDPTAPRCTAEQTEEALQYLMAGVGPFYDDMQRRQIKRLFLEYSTGEVREAIDQLLKQGAIQPRANELGHVLRTNRRHLTGEVKAAKPDRPRPTECLEGDDLHDVIAAVKAGDMDRLKGLTGAT